MKLEVFKEKLKASGIHLILNLVIFISLLYLLRFLWYPSPYFMASGGLQGLKIVALVDVVLGPLLTFVIFNKYKAPHLLKMDVTLILILQILAFTWGIWAIYMQRPVAVTFWDDGFYTVSARALSEQENYIITLSEFGDTPPVFTYVDRPLTGESAEKLRETIKNHDHIPPFHIASLYKPYKENFHSILDRKFPMDQFETFLEKNPRVKSHVERILDKHQVKFDDVIPIKLISKYHNMLILFTANGEVLGFAQSPVKNE